MKSFDAIALYKMMVLSLLAFLAPISTLLYSVGALILIDTVLGVYSAYKRNEKISSRRFGNIVTKMLLYQIGIISGYIVEHIIGPGIIPIAKVVALGIALTELKSITESVEEGTQMNIWKFIKGAFKRGAEATNEVIDDIENENKKGT